MAGLGAFYKAGQDYLGRQVIVFVGRQFPAPKVDLAKVCGVCGGCIKVRVCSECEEMCVIVTESGFTVQQTQRALLYYCVCVCVCVRRGVGVVSVRSV